MPAAADLLGLTAEIVAACVARSPVSIDQLPELIRSVHRTLAGLTSGQTSVPAEQERPGPAVSIRRSVTPDHIVCLECGTQVVTLKRHLASQHGLTPEAYRAHWDLPRDYPMVARRFAERRSMLAKQAGFGRIGPTARARATPARSELGSVQDTE